jgi:hypothetical protein
VVEETGTENAQGKEIAIGNVIGTGGVIHRPNHLAEDLDGNLGTLMDLVNSSWNPWE